MLISNIDSNVMELIPTVITLSYLQLKRNNIGGTLK